MIFAIGGDIVETKVSKIILKHKDGTGEVVNLCSDDGKLMLNKLLKLLKEHGNDLLVPSELIIELIQSYQQKAKRLRKLTKVEAERDKLLEEVALLNAEIDDLSQELTNAESAYDQLDEDFNQIKEQLDDIQDIAWKFP